MFTTIEGMHRDGKIERSEMPCDMCEGTPGLATFLFSILPTYKRAVDEPLGAFAGCRGGAQWNNAGIHAEGWPRWDSPYNVAAAPNGITREYTPKIEIAPLTLKTALRLRGEKGTAGYYDLGGKNRASKPKLRGRAGTTFGAKRKDKSRLRKAKGETILRTTTTCANPKRWGNPQGFRAKERS